jgi:hypothetical protein
MTMPADTDGTFHMVWCRAGLVAIRCLTCWHADLLDERRLPGMITRGNLRKVADLKFKCSICFERDFHVEIPPTHLAAADFMGRKVPTETRYFYHPESDCLFKTFDGETPNDGLVEEITVAQYREIKERQLAAA